MNGLHGVLAPGEGAVGEYHHAGHLGGIDGPVFEGFDDDCAGFLLVFALDFRVGHGAGAGNGAVEVIALGGAHGGNVLARLGEGGGPAGMGMHDAAAFRESLVKL